MALFLLQKLWSTDLKRGSFPIGGIKMEDEKKNQNADTKTATEHKAQENQEQKTDNKNEGE